MFLSRLKGKGKDWVGKNSSLDHLAGVIVYGFHVICNSACPLEPRFLHVLSKQLKLCCVQYVSCNTYRRPLKYPF
jgi:hypothetical protein